MISNNEITKDVLDKIEEALSKYNASIGCINSKAWEEILEKIEKCEYSIFELRRYPVEHTKYEIYLTEIELIVEHCAYNEEKAIYTELHEREIHKGNYEPFSAPFVPDEEDKILKHVDFSAPEKENVAEPKEEKREPELSSLFDNSTNEESESLQAIPDKAVKKSDNKKDEDAEAEKIRKKYAEALKIATKGIRKAEETKIEVKKYPSNEDNDYDELIPEEDDELKGISMIDDDDNEIEIKPVKVNKEPESRIVNSLKKHEEPENRNNVYELDDTMEIDSKNSQFHRNEEPVKREEPKVVKVTPVEPKPTDYNDIKFFKDRDF